MTDELTERTETVSVLIGWTGMRAGSRVACVVIDGEPMTLAIPKGTRGVKVGAKLIVDVEYRDWFTITRMKFNMREGTSETTEERGEYNDGKMHAHPRVVGVER